MKSAYCGTRLLRILNGKGGIADATELLQLEFENSSRDVFLTLL